MHPKLQRYGRLTLEDVERRNIFRSFVVCKNETNQLIIIGSDTNFLSDYKQPFLTVNKEKKVHPSKAIMKANMRGEWLPRQSDMFQNEQVRLKVLDRNNIERQKVMEVFKLV